MWYTSGSGRIELQMTKRQAASASHQGQCDCDVLALSQVPAIRRQLARLAPSDVAAELVGYGAWDETELADHAANLQRLLWIAAGDIVEEITPC